MNNVPENKVAVPPTGVYKGVLQEDMVDTVNTTHQQYIKVWIEGLFEKDGNYPYTYVPDWGLVLPLREGDEVLVKFEHDSLLYPVLYRNPGEIDSGVYQRYDLPSTPSVVPRGTNPYVGENKSEDTVSAHRFGDGSYVICTSHYTVFHFMNGYLLIDKNDENDKNRVFVQGDNIFLMAKEKLNLYADGDVVVKNGGNVNIETTGNTGTIDIKTKSGKTVTINGHLQVTA